MKKLLLILALVSVGWGANFYVRADGSATKANAIGPDSDPTKCMTITTHNAATFSAGDTIFVVNAGGINYVQMTLPSSGSAGNPIVYKGRGGYGIISGGKDISNATYKWTKSASGRNEYYCELAGGGDPSIASPTYVWQDNVRLDVAGTLGSLKNHQVKYGNNDGLAFNTVYIRDDAGDPDITNTLIEYSASTYGFNTASTRNYVQFDSLIFEKGNAAAFRTGATCDNLVFNDCIMRKSYDAMTLTHGTNVTFYRCDFGESYATNNNVNVAGASTNTVKFIFCKFYNTHNYGAYINSTATTTISFLNCVFYGCGNTALYIPTGNANQTVNVYNTAFIAYGWRLSTAYAVNKASGTCNVDYSYWLRNVNIPTTGNYGLNGATDGGHNRTNGFSGIKKHRNRTPFYFSLDDRLSLAPATEISGYGNPKNVKLTWGAPSTQLFTTSEWDEAQLFVNNGNEIALHTRSHAYLDSLNSFTVQYVGAGSAATMTITSTALTTTCTGDVGSNLSVDLTSESYNTIGELVSYIDGLAAYTCSQQTSYNSEVPSTLLKAVSGLDIKTTSVVRMYDTIPFLLHEIGENRADIVSNLSYTPRSILWPFGRTNDYVINWVTDSGWLVGGRQVNSMTFQKNDYDMYQIRTWGSADIYNGTTDAINGATICEGAAFSGEVAGTFQHGYTGGSYSQSQTIIDAIDTAQQLGYIYSLGFSNCIDTIKNRATMYPTSVDSNRFYWLTIPDNSDLRLRATSALVSIGDTTPLSGVINLRDRNGTTITDGSGHVLFNTMSIGMYQYSAPIVSVQPVGDTVQSGSTASLSVTGSANTRDYQWWKKLSGGSWAVVSGATSSSYTTPALSSSDDGSFFKVALGTSSDTIYSDSVRLGILSGPTISEHPASVTQMIGKTALYYSVATGTGNLSFQWYKNSNTVSTDSVYSFTVAETDTNAELYVAVTDDNGTTNSNNAYLYTAIIDSVRPSYIRRDSTLTFYVRGKPDSTANTVAKLNALDMALSAWSGDTVTAVIPTDAPRGSYTKACLLNGSDTLAVSPNTIRVYVPEARARP